MAMQAQVHIACDFLHTTQIDVTHQMVAAGSRQTGLFGDIIAPGIEHLITAVIGICAVLDTADAMAVGRRRNYIRQDQRIHLRMNINTIHIGCKAILISIGIVHALGKQAHSTSQSHTHRSSICQIADCHSVSSIRQIQIALHGICCVAVGIVFNLHITLQGNGLRVCIGKGHRAVSIGCVSGGVAGDLCTVQGNTTLRVDHACTGTGVAGNGGAGSCILRFVNGNVRLTVSIHHAAHSGCGVIFNFTAGNSQLCRIVGIRAVQPKYTAVAGQRLVILNNRVFNHILRVRIGI